ncbi:MAG: glycosyltransferase [Gammaproteobacteria bacterium]|nr:glycosyltransferase [Gammaproteobacteria bacterium]MCP5424777.1 glycosyltransferase [Gammaproteobacteria bacterium]MCP5458246.1 glycosyltransferase [Gammaproteobacteria bacterium]
MTIHPAGVPSSIPSGNPRIAIFIPTFGDGGVEHMLVNLARGFADFGLTVDFLVKDRHLPYLPTLGEHVNLVELRTAKPRELLERLLTYLRQAHPAILMSAKGRDDRLTVQTKRHLSHPPRIFLRAGTNITGRLSGRQRNPFKRWLEHRALRRLYAQADGVICVSHGVADDLARITGLSRDFMQVLRNPVVLPEMVAKAQAPVDHPWLAPDQPPVILGAGGLRRQKNFPLLIRAFARVRAQRPCRLLILGEGRQRERLLELAGELGVGDAVQLPGFIDNPYAYMARAALFVLSSHWEGSPNVLAEALAVGTPVVSTDCPSGPREILQGGRYGRLVPVDDEAALSHAIAAALDVRSDPAQLRMAVHEYTLANSSAAYLRAFGLLQDSRCANPT